MGNAKLFLVSLFVCLTSDARQVFQRNIEATCREAGEVLKHVPTVLTLTTNKEGFSNFRGCDYAAVMQVAVLACRDLHAGSFVPKFRERQEASLGKDWFGHVQRTILEFSTYVSAVGAHVTTSDQSSIVALNNTIIAGMRGVATVWDLEFKDRCNSHCPAHLAAAQWNFALIRNCDCRRQESAHAPHRGVNTNHQNVEFDMIRRCNDRMAVSFWAAGGSRHLDVQRKPGRELVAFMKTPFMRKLRSSFGNTSTYAEGQLDEGECEDIQTAEVSPPLQRCTELDIGQYPVFAQFRQRNHLHVSDESPQCFRPLDCIRLPGRIPHLAPIKRGTSFIQEGGPDGDTYVFVVAIVLECAADLNDVAAERRCCACVRPYRALGRVDTYTQFDQFRLDDSMYWVPVTALLSPIHMHLVKNALIVPPNHGTFLLNRDFIKRSG
jgi:hypothetical protein